jgi:DNA-binding transcriptional LysR family regulator
MVLVVYLQTMNQSPPSLSTDQIAAIVELARHGSLRAAANALFITEQGVRNRLLALEQRLGVELYRKSRGRRSAQPLTEHGRRFLPKAIEFLDEARELAGFFSQSAELREIHVAASQYLILYVLIEAVKRFHASFPEVRVRLSSHSEQEIEELLLNDSRIAFGVAAPYEPSPQLEYRHLFALDWSLVCPARHPLARRARVSLGDLVHTPLILFERGSTGRQHVIDAFHAQGLSPQIDMETTNTEIIVRMVEAGLGVSIVPLLADGAVTKNRRVAVRNLASEIRPIQSGVLVRRGESLSAASEAFIRALLPAVKRSGRRDRDGQ